jgi:caa(3)-type oxidase subunit IV
LTSDRSDLDLSLSASLLSGTLSHGERRRNLDQDRPRLAPPERHPGLDAGGAYLDIRIWKLPLAPTLACAKAGLVIFIFMELKDAGATARLFVTVALVWLCLLFGMTFGDELTRNTLPLGFR